MVSDAGDECVMIEVGALEVAPKTCKAQSICPEQIPAGLGWYVETPTRAPALPRPHTAGRQAGRKEGWLPASSEWLRLDDQPSCLVPS